MADVTPNVENIARALKQVAENGNKFMNDDVAAREKLVASARELVLAAETPIESLMFSIFAQPVRVVVARIAVDLKIFEAAVADGGRPKSNEDLAAATGASPTLVKRISRVCVSMGMLAEQGPNLYVPNAMTNLLATKAYASGIIFCFEMTAQSFAKLPEYLRNTNFQNPEDANNGPFQYATNSPSSFAWVVQHPDVFEAFHDYTHALRKQLPRWTDMYPVQSRLIEGLKPSGDASVLVDMGGGTGQVLQDFRDAFPQYPGRLVLQEIPEVIASAAEKGVGVDGSIELQTHSFFDPQPVKGARAYFMRSVMHDWPDDQCRKILGHLKDAMEPGYSRILINDCIVSDQQASWFHVSLDIHMMAQGASRERTRSEWRALIESCGLEIAGFYNKGEGNEGIVEVVRSV